MSRARAIATFRFNPPHSMMRVNSQVSPFETASVERSEPTDTTTIAAFPASAGRSPSAQQRERLEIDAGQLDAGLLAGRDIAVDEVAVGDDEQYTPDRRAFLIKGLAENLVVEHGLLERNRERLLGAEANGVLELLRIVDAADVEGSDADAVARDAEPHGLLRELVVLEEQLQRLGEGLGLAQLAADDDAGLEVLPGDLHQLRVAVVHDSGGGQLGGADLEADEPLLAARAACRLGCLGRLRGLWLPWLFRLTGERELRFLAGFSSSGAGCSAAAGFGPRFGSRSLSLISFLKSISLALCDPQRRGAFDGDPAE